LIQKKINDAAQSARENIREIIDFVSKNQEFIKLLQLKTDSIVFVELEDIRMYANAVSKWFDFCEEFQEFDKIVARNKIEEYNKVASESNAEYNQQVAELSAIRNSLVTLRTQMIEKEQIIKNCQREIKEFDEQSSETIKKIQEEKRICEFNAKIIEAL